jgi:hypothetical protein
MTVGNFPHEDSLVLDQTVEADLAVFGDHKQVSVIVREFERLDDVVHLDVVLDQERFRIVNNNVIAVFTHDSKLLERLIFTKDSICKGNMNKFWRKLQVHHFDWQMLSCGVVNGN